MPPYSLGRMEGLPSLSVSLAREEWVLNLGEQSQPGGLGVWITEKASNNIMCIDDAKYMSMRSKRRGYTGKRQARRTERAEKKGIAGGSGGAGGAE